MTDEEYAVQKEIYLMNVEKADGENKINAEKERFAKEMADFCPDDVSKYELAPKRIKKPFMMRVKERIEKYKIKLKNTF